jgi:hypothetical protein
MALTCGITRVESQPMEAERPPRDRLLTVLAVLMALLAISNFTKPLSQAAAPQSDAGFVFFGYRLHGLANAILGPLFGLVLATYAYGVWTMRRWVAPLAAAYAVYVIVNLVSFVLHPPAGSDTPALGLLAYAFVAIGVSSGGAILLHRRREALR